MAENVQQVSHFFSKNTYNSDPGRARVELISNARDIVWI